MKNCTQIYNAQSLTDKEALIYAILTWAESNNKSCSRAYLSKILGNKQDDQITIITNSLRDKGFISKTVAGVRSIAEYSRNKRNDSFCFISNNVLLDSAIPAKVRGFFIRFASLAFSDSLTINYSCKEIAEKLGICGKTLKTRINELKQFGLIAEKDGSFIIVKGMEKIIPAKVLKYAAEIKQFQAQGGQLTESMVILIDWAKKGFENVNMSPIKALTLCQSGCLVKGFTSKKKIESESFAI